MFFAMLNLMTRLCATLNIFKEDNYGTTAITGGAGGAGLQWRKRFSAAGTHSVHGPIKWGRIQ